MEAISFNRTNLKSNLEAIAEEYDLGALTPNFVKQKLENVYGRDLTDRKTDIDAALKDIISSRRGNFGQFGQGSTTTLEEGDSPEGVTTSRDDDSMMDDIDPVDPVSEPESPTRDEPVRRQRRSRTTKPRRNRSKATPRPSTSSKRKSAQQSKVAKKSSQNNTQKSSSSDHGKIPKRPSQSKTTERPGIKSSSSKGLTHGETSKNLRNDSHLRKKYRLCDNLAEVVGMRKSTEKQLIRKMLSVIHRRNLKDPKDASFIICDAQMRKLFGKKRVRTVDMLKHLSKHLHEDP